MIEKFKRPEYTGEARCLPCTILNIALLATISALAALKSGVIATILVVVGVISIWLRGYFVPYTPRIGPWVTDGVAEFLGRKPASQSGIGSLALDDISGEVVIDELLRAGVLESSDAEDLHLSVAFRAEWDAKIKEVRAMDLGEFERWSRTVFRNGAVAEVELKEQLWSDPYAVITFDSGEESVLRYPLAVAELSAITLLEDLGLESNVCLHASGALRAFLDECPLCDEPLDVSRFDGCCGNPRGEAKTPGLVCKRCKTVLYKYPE